MDKNANKAVFNLKLKAEKADLEARFIRTLTNLFPLTTFKLASCN